jgi:hypothetical protein
LWQTGGSCRRLRPRFLFPRLLHLDRQLRQGRVQQVGVHLGRANGAVAEQLTDLFELPLHAPPAAEQGCRARVAKQVPPDSPPKNALGVLPGERELPDAA